MTDEVSVLTICPSRGRPDTIVDMIQSFKETACPGNYLVVYLNEDDPKLLEYEKVCREFKRQGFRSFQFDVGPRKFIAEVYNEYSWKSQAQYFAPVNDDHYFHTFHWDKKLIDILEQKGQGWGIAMADDLLSDWSKYQHPSGCIVSGKMVQELGYMVYPKIHHIGVDVMLMKICQGVNRLFMTRDVVIEHRHWINGRRNIDDNYKWVYGDAEQSYGNAMVKEYLFQHYENDVKKLLNAIVKEQNIK
jgi:hypothetical protein